jgi:hypothetical protein
MPDERQLFAPQIPHQWRRPARVAERYGPCTWRCAAFLAGGLDSIGNERRGRGRGEFEPGAINVIQVNKHLPPQASARHGLASSRTHVESDRDRLRPTVMSERASKTFDRRLPTVLFSIFPARSRGRVVRKASHCAST